MLTPKLGRLTGAEIANTFGSLQKDRRWWDVIPILLIAVLKRQAAEVAEREFLGRSYSLLRSQLDRHDAPYVWTACAAASLF